MPWVRGDIIRVIIPGAPKPLQRNRHRIVRPRGKPEFISNYLPAESRAEQSTIRHFGHTAMAGRPLLDGVVEMRLVAYMPIPQSWSNKKRVAAIGDQIRPTSKPDLSNMWRLAEDAFKHIIWRDDAQITDGGLWKRYSDRPRLAIEISPLTFRPG